MIPTSFTTPLVARSHEELEALGLEMVPEDTLLGIPQYFQHRKLLDRWCERIPSMHQPFGPHSLPPGPHQLKYAAMNLSRRHNLLLWTVGVQKSATSILHIYGWFGEQLFPNIPWDELDDGARLEAMARAVPDLPPGSIHIVTRKKILKKTWMLELHRMGLDRFAEIIESESQLVNTKAPIILYHFDFPSRIQTDRGRAMRVQGKGKRLKADGSLYFRGEPMSKLIRKLHPPSLMIVDEIHRLRPDSARTRELTYIRMKAKRVLGLTGTPMDGWLVHYGAVLEFIYGPRTRMFPYSSAEDFARRYTRTKVVTQDIVTGGETVGKKRPMPGVHPMQVPQFVKVTRHLAHRLTSRDPEVKQNVKFPPARIQKVLVEMDFKQQKFYQDLYAQHEANMRALSAQRYGRGAGRMQARANILELINQLRMAATCPHALGYSGGPTEKFQTVLEICQQAKAEGRKVLVYTNFIEESRQLSEYLSKQGIGTVRLYVQDPRATPRALSEEAQMELLDRHEDEDDITALVSNLELIAEGLTLTWASVIINVSPCWRGNLYAQGLGRAIRPGQVHPHVDVYDLVTSGSVEVYVQTMLQAKNKATAAFIDRDLNPNDSGSAELDAFELVNLLMQNAA